MRRQTFAHAEEHHHVQELMDQQDARVYDRELHRTRQLEKDDRGKELAGIKRKDTLPFWCQRCRLDFLAESIREDERDWGNPDETVSFYRTKCFRGHWCIRLAMDKYKDPYFLRSRMVQQDRAKHVRDIIQPHETGFQLLYGRKNKA